MESKKENAMTIDNKALLTRDQAINTAGLDLAKTLDYANCEPTSRALPDHCGGYQEWSSEVEDNSHRVIAYYYPTTKDLDANSDDLSNVEWEITGYEIQTKPSH